MTNLAGKPPLGLKADKPAKDPEYLARVRELPCCICENWGMQQKSATQAHHPIHDRYATRKVPDRMAVPLCEGHHQGLIEQGKTAVHQRPALWKRLFGPDHHYIAATQDKILGGK